MPRALRRADSAAEAFLVYFPGFTGVVMEVNLTLLRGVNGSALARRDVVDSTSRNKGGASAFRILLLNSFILATT
jgi:hypothetical protein